MSDLEFRHGRQYPIEVWTGIHFDGGWKSIDGIGTKTSDSGVFGIRERGYQQDTYFLLFVM